MFGQISRHHVPTKWTHNINHDSNQSGVVPLHMVLAKDTADELALAVG